MTLNVSPEMERASARKGAILDHANRIAGERQRWIARNRAFYRDDRNYMKFLIPKGVRVLDLGCGTGDLLAELEPSYGVGVDISPAMIDQAKRHYPQLSFTVGDIEDDTVIAGIDGPFDYIVLSDTIGMLDDIETALRRLQPLCGPDTRLVIAYYSAIWEPLLKIAEAAGQKMPQPPTNFLNTTDFLNILDLADFEPIKMDYRQLVPRRLFGLGTLINRFIAPIPGIRRFCLRTYVVARSLTAERPAQLSASIIIPCRNERGNIEAAIKRLPAFGKKQEIIYVEGNSSDGTYEECLRVQQAYAATHTIKVLKQDGRGKGDAVRKAFANATGDVLMILDADLTMPPEALPKFYSAIVSGKADFVNGTRLVYPMENQAMRPLNFIANRFFAGVFSYLVNQRFSDTLCGTKVLTRQHYEAIARGRDYFGEFDPFGDFDLIFGASKQNLKIVEVPVHYSARVYGETQISRFRDGWLLLRMVGFAFMKLKAF
ncbi:glycosyltransferase [Pseudorhodoplanes sp.]|uniref:glycosyltransferase n=1 Tax=Pseudorhodoplanes sp. TaxID=1934341 RepID=UPI002BC82640|nr:glycosyltransferase [Pseudorhodoplanes sp.]HWV54425.1 glycosyltransferase [Pseudorhodoplanes sp.]